MLSVRFRSLFLRFFSPLSRVVYLVAKFSPRRFSMFMERGKTREKWIWSSWLNYRPGDLCACLYATLSPSFFLHSLFFPKGTKIFASCEYLYCPRMNIYAGDRGRLYFIKPSRVGLCLYSVNARGTFAENLAITRHSSLFYSDNLFPAL